MRNFNQITIFAILTLSVFELQTSNTMPKKKSALIGVYWNNWRIDNQEHEIIRDGRINYIHLISKSARYADFKACDTVKNKISQVQKDLYDHLDRWADQYDIDKDYKEFYEHLADFPTKQTIWWITETLFEFALKSYTQSTIPCERMVIINLTRHGANLDKPVCQCNNVYDYAVKHNKQELIQLLQDLPALHKEQDQQITEIIKKKYHDPLKNLESLKTITNDLNVSKQQVTKLPIDLEHDDWSWKDSF